MNASPALVIGAIALALFFDFMNGFHDAANSVATVVSTRVLRPRQAVLLAAVCNFVAFLIFGLHVADTIGKDVVDTKMVDVAVILATLFGAIAWDVLTWIYGLPSSSMHALIGALGGAVSAKAGFGALKGPGFLKIAVSIVLSPLLGFVLAFALMWAVSYFFFNANPRKIDRVSRKLQILSASAYSLGHGGNDAQKTMGIIAILLFTTGRLKGEFHVPFWVVLACHGAMALGTYFGGWRIVRTMGMRLVKLKPVDGFCAETGGSLTLFLATGLGIPVSTTHTIAGAIIGVGAVNKWPKIRWNVALRIVWAWVLTLPLSGLLAALAWLITSRLVQS